MSRILPLAQSPLMRRRGGAAMTLEDSMHAFGLRVMVRAQELGNVTRACREFGASRSLLPLA